MNKTGVIYGINGPVVYLKGNTGFKMSEMVYVGKERLVGEVIALTKDTTTVQVFEETTGLKPGETVTASGDALSVTLGPGILNNIFDGIERPLSEIAKQSGKYISRGLTVDSLDTEKKWDVHVTVSEGEELMGGAIIAETQETRSIVHKSMVPPDVNGTVIWAAKDGKYTILDPIVKLKLEDGTEKEITLAQKWPIRVPRPTLKRYPASVPLITGQRILDTMFPIAKGGTAAIPGGFGTGKTMTQHQIAKWSDADIIIYIGCGERGNEMTQVLEEFQELIDPKSGNPLMDRTTLIANTSNMPVAAREASLYSGLTLAEYYRDMGYDVAIMADSTSRWAEALREMSGRLEEMPGEEGYPAYLGSRLAQFYERAGHVISLGKDGREGALSVIGAVSPPGGDTSEPVSQATLRIVKVFWGLDHALSHRRHFPAINWLNSYSLYQTKDSENSKNDTAKQREKAKRTAFIQNIEKLKDEYRIMRDGLIKCRNYMFNFLENPHIPSDNNASERGIRKLKIKMKNACTFRSEWGADAFLQLHSIVETAKKHTQTSYKAIRSLFDVTDCHAFG